MGQKRISFGCCDGYRGKFKSDWVKIASMLILCIVHELVLIPEGNWR